MANTIQIKTGSNVPPSLQTGELGYSLTNGYLYVGNLNGSPTHINAGYASTAGHANTATNATNSESAEVFKVKDTRDYGTGDTFSRTPDQLDAYKVSAHFGYVTNAGSSWRGILSVKAWTTGYAAWQLIGNASNSDDDSLYYRTGRGTGWRALNEVLHAGTFHKYATPIDGSGNQYAYYYPNAPADDANTFTNFWSLSAGANTPFGGNYAYIQNIIYSSPAQRTQLAFSYYGSPRMATRTLYGGTWQPWCEVIHNKNYTNYCAAVSHYHTWSDINKAGNLEVYSTDTTGSYSNSAVEIREVNLVGTAQTAPAYAPQLSFHWGGRTQKSIALRSDGHLVTRTTANDGYVLLDSGNYTSYTSPPNLYGTSIPSSLLPGQIYVRY